MEELFELISQVLREKGFTMDGKIFYGKIGNFIGFDNYIRAAENEYVTKADLPEFMGVKYLIYADDTHHYISRKVTTIVEHKKFYSMIFVEDKLKALKYLKEREENRK